MAKFAINASGAMLLPSLVQVSESISGSVVPLAMFLIPVCEIKRLKQVFLNVDTRRRCKGAFDLNPNLKSMSCILADGLFNFKLTPYYLRTHHVIGC